MNKYLITGFSGFVSQYVIDFLEQKNEPVSVLGLDLDPHGINFEQFQNVDCNFIQTDLSVESKVKNIISDYQPDYILHLAAISSVGFSWIKPVQAYKNNVNTLLSILEALRKLETDCRLLSIGSSEEYGRVSESHLPLTESAPLNPISPYAVAKLSQEYLAQIYAKSYQLNIVCTRSFNHIGPGQTENFAIPSFAKQLMKIKNENRKLRGINTGDVSIIRDFTDVRDVARAYDLLLRNGERGGIYNVCSGTGHKLESVIHRLATLLDMEIDIHQDPKMIRPMDNPVIIGSNEKIKKECGWEPEISFSQSLRDVMDFLEHRNNT